VRYLKFSIAALICLGIICSIILPCSTVVRFASQEIFIPQQSIKKEYANIKTVRWIQLLNWPRLKHQTLSKYPMIEDISLQFLGWSELEIVIKEKQPWAIVIHGNKQYLVSEDGVILNKDMTDIELPNQKIMMVKASKKLWNNVRLENKTLNRLKEISNGLNTIPFFNLQHVVLEAQNIHLIDNTGIILYLGEGGEIDKKFKKLKYFMGTYRKKISTIKSIDLRFLKRIIIK
jgi:hypothetical protein